MDDGLSEDCPAR